MTFFDCTADLVGQLNRNGQKGMLQIDAPPVENFWLRHCLEYLLWASTRNDVGAGVFNSREDMGQLSGIGGNGRVFSSRNSRRPREGQRSEGAKCLAFCTDSCGSFSTHCADVIAV